MSSVGGPQPGLMNIGEEARPPFAVLPDPRLTFLNRAKRLDSLATGHVLEPYLRFLATLARIQGEVAVAAAARVAPPDPIVLEQARTHAMPPLARNSFEPGAAADAALDDLITAFLPQAATAAARSAAESLATLPAELRHDLMSAVLRDEAPADDVARHVLVAAALQAYFAAAASRLDAETIKPVAEGVCPVCAAPPLASAVVGWPSANNTRFCTCSLCATQWNVVRVKCTLCGTTEGISYLVLDKGPDTVKAECCDTCKKAVKVVYQVTDPALEPMADDIATLALDVLVTEAGFSRGGVNPFLTGY